MTTTDRARDFFSSKESVLFLCKECGRGLLLPATEAARRTYCSRECVYAGQRRARAAGTLAGPPGHATDAGREKSLRNLVQDGSQARVFWDERAHAWFRCLECLEPFPSRATIPPFYCAEKCRQRAVSRQKQYSVEPVCAICKIAFRTGRYRPARTCSRSCASVLRHRERKEKET